MSLVEHHQSPSSAPATAIGVSPDLTDGDEIAAPLTDAPIAEAELHLVPNVPPKRTLRFRGRISLVTEGPRSLALSASEWEAFRAGDDDEQ